jgi:hypothetical protein
MTPEEMQASSHRIMGRFYRFKHMFHIGFHLLWFPVLVFYLPNMKRGFEKWYRIWANQVTRFGGWVIMRRWYVAFRKDPYTRKLAAAQEYLSRSFKGPIET